ncbi:disease resistance protein At4g27190-like [Cryptomeria japonica]|uniref:disease resistance protein At4g27190-like n=1 Tax=Cryptomeria japonica TaxID=3369 RepID=UPI0027DAB456|nr:disease resistance protein At4g27190-like [Cryptomeria japonica]
MAVHVAEIDQNGLFRAGQSLTEFPSSAFKNVQWVRMSLMHNRISFLPHEIFCSNLVTLLLNSNTIEEVLEGFSETLNELKLTGLQELDMWKTLFAFSLEFETSEELKKASLQDVCKLHRLKRLRLTLKSPIEERTVGNLLEIQELWLLWMPQVHQKHLPTDIRAMQNLERLHLYDCHIEGSPDLFSELENLNYLKLKSSQLLLTLSGLGLGCLYNLKEIEIEECPLLTELGEEFGRKGCFPRLRELKLWILPSLESLSNSVEKGALPMLQTLAIFHCIKVKVLPWGLDNVESLEQIRGDNKWWNEISWEDEEMKNHLHAKYVEIVEIHDYYLV